MKKEQLYIAIKGVLVVLLAAMIIPHFVMPKNSNVPFDTVVQKTTAGLDMELYPSCTAQDIKRYLGLVPSQYEQVAFYRTSDALNASELLIVQFKEDGQAADFKQKIGERMRSQEKIYAGYAPEQEQLVKDGIVFVRANYALYMVGAQVSLAKQQFAQGLRG